MKKTTTPLSLFTNIKRGFLTLCVCLLASYAWAQPTCRAHFIHYPSSGNPDSVHFYIDSVNATSAQYYWSFGDGTSSNLLNPWHLYANTGTYYACLYVKDSSSAGTCVAHWCDSVKVGNPPPPVCHAHFVHHPSTANGDSVYFNTDTSNATGTKYAWMFGDGTSSTTLTPWHFYAGPGTYYACLEVNDSTSAGTCTARWCDSIKVTGNPPPPPHNCSAHFIHYFLTSYPDSVHFYPDSTSKNSANTIYYWNFGDGKSATFLNPWHVYAPGNYWACLTVRDSTSSGLCYSTFCDSVHVGNPPPPPICNAHFSHYSATNADSIHFYPPTNPSNSHYQWTFGDGTTSDLQSPWHFYGGPGTYTVCLTVKDTNSTGTCMDHWCDTIKVGNPPPPPPPVCNAHFQHYSLTTNADSVHFYGYNPTGTHYLWTFGDGTVSDNPMPWHYYLNAGTYYVCLTVWDTTSAGTCKDSWCDSIKVGNPPPPPPPQNCSAHFVHYFISSKPDSIHFYPDSSGKNSAGTTYYWTFGDGKTSSLFDPWHVYAPGNYFACLTVRDSTASGICYSHFCDSIHVGNTPPPPLPTCNSHFVHYSSSTNIDSVHFYHAANDSTTRYYWSFGDGKYSTDVYPWHVYAPGTYIACLTVSDSTAAGKCKETWCDTVKVGTTPPPPPPVCNAHFTHYSLNTNADSVHFGSSNPTGTHYSWTFGDGTTSDNPSPWHYYLNAGTYTVCLTVWDTTSSGTCTDHWCDTVKIGTTPPPPPVCNAHYQHYSSTTNIDSVHFYGYNPTGTHYSWTFGDGTTSDNPSPWHFYTGPGVYYVCLTVWDTTSAGTCTDHFCDSIKIGNPPPPPPPVCNAHFNHYSIASNPDSVHFYPSTSTPAGYHFSWTFGDGKTSTDQFPWHFYSSPGVYYVCLVVEDSTASGKCRDYWCDSVHVGNPPPPPPPVCNAHFSHYSITSNIDSIHFYSSNPTGTHYSWTFGDGKTSDNPTPWHLYSGPGTYTVCLTVWDTTSAGTCTDHWCDTIKIGNNPPPPPPVCNAKFTHYSTGNPDSVHFYILNTPPAGSHYLWTFGDGTSSTNQDPWHFYTGTGTFYACLTISDSTSAGTCKDTWCDTVHVGSTTPPVCNAQFSHYSGNNPDSVHFYPISTGSGHYSWTFGDGTTSTNKDPWHHYLNAGTYYVCLTVWDSTSAGSCKNTWCDSVHITAPNPPACNAHYSFYPNNQNPDSIHFYSSNPTGTRYKWTFGDGTTSDNPYPWHFYSAPGVYYVCLTVWDTTSAGTCTDTHCDSVHVIKPVPPAPPVCNAEFTDSASTTNADSIHFTPKPNPPGTHYTWTFGDGKYSTNQDPWHLFATPGIYVVCLTVTDSNSAGSCGDTWCDSVHVAVPRPPHFVNIYPNPTSQMATVSLMNMESTVSFSIFDPIGHLVYKKENLSDGNFDIVTANLIPGIYFYQVNNSSEILKTGKLLIVE